MFLRGGASWCDELELFSRGMVEKRRSGRGVWLVLIFRFFRRGVEVKFIVLGISSTFSVLYSLQLRRA